MGIFEYTCVWLFGMFVGIGIGLYHQDSYLDYLLKENLIDIPTLIQKKYKVK
jgi:hypothetical protein